MGNPFFTYAGVLERSSHLVHLYTPNQPEVVGYQMWANATVDDAYGNPAGSGVGGSGCSALFTVARGEFFRSPSLRRKGLAAIPESRKGTTQMAFDPDDFTVAGMAAPMALEDMWLMLRLQENRNNVGLLNLAGNPATPALGPIYLVPPASTFGMSGASFTLSGTAPSATGSTAGVPPVYNQNMLVATPRPMHLVFPSPLQEFTLRNLGGGNDIIVSLGPTQTMMTLKQGADFQLYNGMTKEMVIACPAAGGCSFSLHGVLGRG